MRIRFPALAALTLLLTMSALASAQQPATIDEVALKKEVNAFMDQYWQLWSSGRSISWRRASITRSDS